MSSRGFINDMHKSIYNRKHWHSLSHSFHFFSDTKSDWQPTHPSQRVSCIGSRLPIFNSVHVVRACPRSYWFPVPYYNVLNNNTYTQWRILNYLMDSFTWWSFCLFCLMAGCNISADELSIGRPAKTTCGTDGKGSTWPPWENATTLYTERKIIESELATLY